MISGWLAGIGSWRRGRARRWRRAPIVVGATGGSGTRVVHGLLAEAGVFMGRRLNDSGDAMDFEPFLEEFINRILVETRSLDYGLRDLSPGLRREVVASFRRALDAYRPAMGPGGRWGWKNPRSMYVLPVIHHVFADLRFIHLVRDGRDMALSANQNQPRKHYAALFGDEPAAPMALPAARLWAAANLQVAAWAERELGARYLRLRFEDLCRDGAAAARGLADWLELRPDGLVRAADGVRAPRSVGRWGKADPAVVEAVTGAAASALAAFGYTERRVV